MTKYHLELHLATVYWEMIRISLQLLGLLLVHMCKEEIHNNTIVLIHWVVNGTVQEARV